MLDLQRRLWSTVKSNKLRDAQAIDQRCADEQVSAAERYRTLSAARVETLTVSHTTTGVGAGGGAGDDPPQVIAPSF